jgi:DNA ligase-1
MKEIRLYRKNSLGIGTWRVWMVEPVGATTALIMIAHATIEGGTEVMHNDSVKINGSGRNILQQVELEMNSRASRMRDKGYKDTRDEALAGSTNQLGLINPMLAQKIKDVRITQSMMTGAFMQVKYDGHRCLITKQGGEMLAYSRKGKPIESIPGILEDASRWMQDGDTLDGELYIHGVALQTISSLIKRVQPDSRKLCYHWYDMADRDMVFKDRFKLMQDLHANCQNPQLMLVETVQVARMAEVYDHFRKARAGGYEGSMLRLSTHGYQDAKRSDQLLKVKERHDCEVKILGARASSQGWAILQVQHESGKVFDISAPGDVAAKTRMLHEIDKYIGKDLTIEYANLTDDGIPFHAVAIRVRDDV